MAFLGRPLPLTIRRPCENYWSLVGNHLPECTMSAITATMSKVRKSQIGPEVQETQRLESMKNRDAPKGCTGWRIYKGSVMRRGRADQRNNNKGGPSPCGSATKGHPCSRWSSRYIFVYCIKQTMLGPPTSKESRPRQGTGYWNQSPHCSSSLCNMSYYLLPRQAKGVHSEHQRESAAFLSGVSAA